MGKAKWLAFLLLLYCAQAKGQGCRVIHSENLGLPSTSILFPNEVAAQGGMTATLTLSTSDGVISHNITTAPHTTASLGWNTANASSVEILLSVNGGSPQPYLTNLASSGSYQIALSNIWADTFILVATGANGTTTKDRVVWTVVAGANGSIIFEDDFPTNYYEELKNNFNGTTSMNFEYCPGAATATHTAPFFGSITNPTSGETQSFNTSIAFRPNGGYDEEVPPTCVSFLPGDKPPQTSTTGRVMCTIAGDFVGLISATGDSTKNQRTDKKMATKVKIATTVQASDGGWYVDIWCEEYPPTLPIWAPNEIYTSLAPLNQYYWTLQTCSSSPPGTDPGPGWHCPEISGGPGPAAPGRFFPSFTSVKGSCNTLANTPAPY